MARPRFSFYILVHRLEKADPAPDSGTALPTATPTVTNRRPSRRPAPPPAPDPASPLQVDSALPTTATPPARPPPWAFRVSRPAPGQPVYFAPLLRAGRPRPLRPRPHPHPGSAPAKVFQETHPSAGQPHPLNQPLFSPQAGHAPGPLPTVFGPPRNYVPRVSSFLLTAELLPARQGKQPEEQETPRLLRGLRVWPQRVSRGGVALKNLARIFPAALMRRAENY